MILQGVDLLATIAGCCSECGEELMPVCDSCGAEPAYGFIVVNRADVLLLQAELDRAKTSLESSRKECRSLSSELHKATDAYVELLKREPEPTTCPYCGQAIGSGPCQRSHP